MSAKKVVVRNSPIHGRGIFARHDIARGERIIRYRGALRTHAEVEDDHDSDGGHTFLFTLNPTYVIDGGRGGNSARWINHSCRPNCEAWWIEDESGNPRLDQIVIESRRKISAGEELTYDYGIEPGERVTRRLKALWACRCGEPRCRGTLLKI